mmetsp:Transcript_8373/g.26175  ORF Transcript_8373/g.26175 Transcript_8373/m.26175 type:complete len:255 (+) Transcript_8373:1072-1836(+)
MRSSRRKEECAEPMPPTGAANELRDSRRSSAAFSSDERRRKGRRASLCALALASLSARRPSLPPASGPGNSPGCSGSSAPSAPSPRAEVPRPEVMASTPPMASTTPARNWSHCCHGMPLNSRYTTYRADSAGGACEEARLLALCCGTRRLAKKRNPSTDDGGEGEGAVVDRHHLGVAKDHHRPVEEVCGPDGGDDDDGEEEPKEVVGEGEAARGEELVGDAVRAGAVAADRLREHGGEAARGDDGRRGDHRTEE